jgi:peroxiredoxin
LKKLLISYSLLSDQRVQTMLADDIVNNEYATDSEHYGIPYPSGVVIDNKGNVIHQHLFKGYKKRVKFTDLYSQLFIIKHYQQKLELTADTVDR